MEERGRHGRPLSVRPSSFFSLRSSFLSLAVPNLQRRKRGRKTGPGIPRTLIGFGARPMSRCGAVGQPGVCRPLSSLRLDLCARRTARSEGGPTRHGYRSSNAARVASPLTTAAVCRLRRERRRGLRRRFPGRPTSGSSFRWFPVLAISAPRVPDLRTDGHTPRAADRLRVSLTGPRRGARRASAEARFHARARVASTVPGTTGPVCCPGRGG